MKFNIQDYLRNNTINLGTIEKEVGTTPYKGGHNDIRKTNYDVKLTEDDLLQFLKEYEEFRRTSVSHEVRQLIIDAEKKYKLEKS